MAQQPFYIWPHIMSRQAWALGRMTRTGFRIRTIKWGRLAARMEKQSGEEIRRALIQVEPERYEG